MAIPPLTSPFPHDATALARSILVVDDDDEVRETLHDAICFEGLNVEIAHDGREALEKLRADRHAPWLVLLDLMMPVMDGRAFLKELRDGDAALARTPVIVLTAGSDCREIEATQDISRCLPKTVGIHQLMAAIATCS
jgi:two-component system response regulator MprA